MAMTLLSAPLETTQRPRNLIAPMARPRNCYFTIQMAVLRSFVYPVKVVTMPPRKLFAYA